MEELLDGAGALVGATKDIVKLAGNVAETYDRYKFLPLYGWARKNIMEWENMQSEIMKKRYAVYMELKKEEEAFEAKKRYLDKLGDLAAAAIQKDVENGMSYYEAVARHDPSAAYAVSHTYREAIKSQHAREVTGIFAMHELMKKGYEPVELEETWLDRFTKLVSDMRDEQAFELWGRVLAGEMIKPGTFSLKSLQVLHVMDKRDAETFAKATRAAVAGMLLPNIAEEAGLGFYQIKTLDSLGLIITGVTRKFADAENVENRHYRATLQMSQAKEFFTESYVFTPVGEELMQIVDVDKEDSLRAMQSLSRIMQARFKTKLLIAEKPSS